MVLQANGTQTHMSLNSGKTPNHVTHVVSQCQRHVRRHCRKKLTTWWNWEFSNEQTIQNGWHPCSLHQKDGMVHFVSDFCKLNKKICRKPHPVPKVQDMLVKLEGFRCGSSLDLDMGHCHIELNPDSEKLYATAVGQV